MSSEKGIINIYYGNLNTNPAYDYIATYFRHIYERDWMTTEYARKVVRELDKSEVLGNGVIDSPYLGLIPPEKISGGAQALIASYMLPDIIFPLRNLGDNCAKLLYEGSLEKTTSWFYEGYVPMFLPEQKFRIMCTGQVFQTNDSPCWFVDNAPNMQFIKKYLTREEL